MIKSLLIANRGEIACRIIRTARRMGIRTVAVYSDADAKALHVRMADEAVHIGPSPARESYLRGDKIIEAAKATRAKAIHPGYGFLSENADFAQAVIDAGLIWVGPKPDSIRAMGLKDAAANGELESYSKPDLVNLASSMGIEGRTNMTKAELVDAIEEDMEGSVLRIECPSHSRTRPCAALRRCSSASWSWASAKLSTCAPVFVASSLTTIRSIR